MPELPEVETIVRELHPHLVQRTVVSAHVDWAKTIAEPARDIEQFVARIVGRQITDVTRRAKFIVIHLDSAMYLIVHLRMSGRLLLKPRAEDARHLRVQLGFAGGAALYFYNPRKFGRVWLVGDLDPVLGGLGPEPLSTGLTPDVFVEMMRRRRGMLKPLLLNQRFIAGLGNIYVDESLFRAGLGPRRQVNTLTRTDIVRLHSAIRSTLRQALAHHGTSFDHVFVRPQGERGRQQEGLRVYGRHGLPCVRCGSPIERVVVGGRGTHFCPRCQK